MGKALPSRNPAVVLRSHYDQLRMLLAIALVAIAGLGATVAILANEDGDSSPARSAVELNAPSKGVASGVTKGVKHGPATTDRSRPHYEGSVLVPGTRTQSSRPDGGPEEGTAQRSFGPRP